MQLLLRLRILAGGRVRLLIAIQLLTRGDDMNVEKAVWRGIPALNCHDDMNAEKAVSIYTMSTNCHAINTFYLLGLTIDGWDEVIFSDVSSVATRVARITGIDLEWRPGKRTVSWPVSNRNHYAKVLADNGFKIGFKIGS